MSTEDVLAHHLQAIPEGVDSIMRDYAEDSVLFTPDGALRGLEGIRAFFTGFLGSSPPELIQALTLLRQEIDGEYAYILWKAEPFIPLATDTFLVRGGKIRMQRFAALVAASPDA
jgi:hypothetical protein